MDNPPDRIYLQYCTDGETTWCTDQVNDNDTEYLKATPEREAASEMRAMLQEAGEWIGNNVSVHDPLPEICARIDTALARAQVEGVEHDA